MRLGESVLRGPVLASRGVELLKQWAGYKRDYLLPRIKGDGTLERKMASYADAMAASVHLLAMAGLPIVVRTCWSEHSERTLLPTGLSLKPIPPADGRWKPEGSDIYMRAYGGRVARLQAIYADAARSENREEEKEISARLWRLAKDWRQAQGDHGGPASAAAARRLG